MGSNNTPHQKGGDVEVDKNICQLCKNRKDKQCTITKKFVARKKLCDTERFTAKK